MASHCLATGFCDSLCVADVNPEAVEACRRTVANNRLAVRVAVYHSDNLDDIPATEQWDLVVGNPPHFADTSPGQLRYHDSGDAVPAWAIAPGQGPQAVPKPKRASACDQTQV